MFCRKCGDQMAAQATVCDSCNTRTQPAVFCHKCATELPANSTRCITCNAKSRAHKRGIHWLPLGLIFVSFICYAFGGYYYFDDSLGVHNYDLPYATVLDYLSVLFSAVALIISIAVIPNNRIVLKVIGILLSLVMLYLSVFWVLETLFI